jgi:hypothetical protein
VIRFIFRTLRLAILASLGAALLGKFMLKSNAGEETQEVDVVTIFAGENLASHAQPFYGGKVLTMFGGTVLDLRKATPAPTGVYLDALVWMGGISVVVPEGWRAEFTGKAVLGGFNDDTRTTADPDVPKVQIGGVIVLGGLQVTTTPPPGVES